MAETLVASNLFQSVTGGSETALPNPTRVTKRHRIRSCGCVSVFLGVYCYFINNICSVSLCRFEINYLSSSSSSVHTTFEGTSDTHTLVANDTTAIFNIIENTSNLFSLNGSTLSFDGAATDLESNVVNEVMTLVA
jgi:hypothetical protein